jgi:spore coat polysaccharide biosynthesis protein SpsF (cytidylyltransferase family)
LVGIIKWGGYAYTANDMKLTFPEGIDAHVIFFNALEASANEAKDPKERDDTPRFIWNHPERFPIFNLEAWLIMKVKTNLICN